MQDRPEADLIFDGSIPEIYDKYLVPLIFEPYAEDLVTRLNDLGPSALLEIAAGSGVVTRAMAKHLPASVSITASDLSEAMLDKARSIGTARPVDWRQADVMDLPFEDATFDVAVCQFGVMFFPDRRAAFAEVARVLRPGGVFLFSVWDNLEENEFAAVVTSSLSTLLGDDSPTFLVRTPHGYFDEATIQADVAAGGFSSPAGFDAVEARSRADTAEIPAIAYCHGTPLRSLLEQRGPEMLAAATAAATAAIEERFGAVDIDGKTRAYVVTARKPA